LNIVERALLARRIKEQRTSTARHLKDLYDLLPPDVERFNRLFDAALRSSGLEEESDEMYMDDADMAFEEAGEESTLERAVADGLPSYPGESAGKPMPAAPEAKLAGRLKKKARQLKEQRMPDMEVMDVMDAAPPAKMKAEGAVFAAKISKDNRKRDAQNASLSANSIANWKRARNGWKTTIIINLFDLCRPTQLNLPT
ncbi:MAG: hypothetical protein D3910_11980, partial [Candidatus Electrothrix sp. ATG2]|nr:hypothetical protein [Candidatus Electrothrix sp. ATG2]